MALRLGWFRATCEIAQGCGSGMEMLDIRMWPGVFPWLMEPVGQDLESLNGILRVTENCWGRGVGKGNLWSVWLFFSLFSFVTRIIIDCVQNNLF